MKQLFKVTPLVIAVALANQPVRAGAQDLPKPNASQPIFAEPIAAHQGALKASGPKQGVAMFSSAIIGGLIAGPIGAFVAGVGGALLAAPESPTLQPLGPETLPANNIATLETALKPNDTLAALAPNPPVFTDVAISSSEPANQDTVRMSYSLDPTTGTTIISTSNKSGDAGVVANYLTHETMEQSSAINSATNSTIETQVLFNTNTFSMDAQRQQELAGVLATMVNNPNGLILIDGYADPRGDEAFNLALSEKRAESVATYLEEQGIDRARMVIRSLGESLAPLGINDIAAYEAQRKVTVFVEPTQTASVVKPVGEQPSLQPVNAGQLTSERVLSDHTAEQVNGEELTGEQRSVTPLSIDDSLALIH
ncbi:OmpA family protein [Pseudomonadales bacterium]|nr:OmpA family protein [Pseudomonadales bacterium]